MRRALAIFLLVAASASGPEAAASAQRTFVSVAGNDANAASNCGIGAPCRSFGAALPVTSSGGEIVVLDSGGYGRVTIDRSVAIVAPPGVYAGISVFTGTNGIDIATPGVNVTLRGLTINGQGGDNGVDIANAGDVIVEGCTIAGLGANGILALAGRLFVQDVTFRENGYYGLQTGIEAHLDRVRIEANAQGGVFVQDNARIVVRDSVLADNGGSGIAVVAGALTRVDVESTIVSSNTGMGVYVYALSAGTKAEVTIARSTIARNAASGIYQGGVVATGNAHVSVADSTVTGNFGNGIVNVGGTIVATGNVVTKNAYFGLGNASGTFKTRSNNVVEDNFGGSSSGSLTPIGGL